MEARYPKGSLVLLNRRVSIEDEKAGDTVGIVIGTDNVFHRVLLLSTLSTDEVEHGNIGEARRGEKRNGRR